MSIKHSWQIDIWKTNDSQWYPMAPLPPSSPVAGSRQDWSSFHKSTLQGHAAAGSKTRGADGQRFLEQRTEVANIPGFKIRIIPYVYIKYIKYLTCFKCSLLYQDLASGLSGYNIHALRVPWIPFCQTPSGGSSMTGGGPQIVPLKRGQKSTNSTQGEKECPIPVLAHNFIIKYLKKHDVV